MDLVGIEGNPAVSDAERLKITENTLNTIQKLACKRKTLCDSLRRYDIQYPHGLPKTQRDTFHKMM